LFKAAYNKHKAIRL